MHRRDGSGNMHIAKLSVARARKRRACALDCVDLPNPVHRRDESIITRACALDWVDRPNSVHRRDESIIADVQFSGFAGLRVSEDVAPVHWIA